VVTVALPVELFLRVCEVRWDDEVLLGVGSGAVIPADQVDDDGNLGGMLVVVEFDKEPYSSARSLAA
jgi:hypothetical protein